MNEVFLEKPIREWDKQHKVEEVKGKSFGNVPASTSNPKRAQKSKLHLRAVSLVTWEGGDFVFLYQSLLLSYSW